MFWCSDVDVDDDDEWQRMQEGVEKMEKVLDARSRTSHEVHAPYFPEVRSLVTVRMLAEEKS